MRYFFVAILVAGMTTAAVDACSICQGFAGRPSLRQDAVQARHVYYGTLSNPRLNTVNATGVSNTSATDFTVDQVVKSDSANRRSQKQITIPRYVPVDVKAPPKYLIFCDERNGTLDPYRGTPVQSSALADYLRVATQIDPKDSAKILALAGSHLASTDDDLAGEAFLEFARSEDAAVLQAARKLDPKVIRKLLDDPKTPIERLGLFAYLLGACGAPADAQHLKQMVLNPGDRYRSAMSGLYAGIVMLDAQEGWKTILTVLNDEHQTFPARSAALSALRFCRNSAPDRNRAEALTGLRVLLRQGDIADMAIEDLRRWKMWDLTSEVLAVYDLKTHDAPLMRRGIIRYALSCPEASARQFVQRARTQSPELVKEVEESLEFEKSEEVKRQP
ncbi:MAG: hypothetical protein K1X57_04930 [Gemmataceae bacterium]|nr:hypothetical protein [Gemmataceae bacterium]